eukprot:8459331-Pyramimonas_sp.AAC.1
MSSVTGGRDKARGGAVRSFGPSGARFDYQRTPRGPPQDQGVRRERGHQRGGHRGAAEGAEGGGRGDAHHAGGAQGGQAGRHGEAGGLPPHLRRGLHDGAHRHVPLDPRQRRPHRLQQAAAQAHRGHPGGPAGAPHQEGHLLGARVDSEK